MGDSEYHRVLRLEIDKLALSVANAMRKKRGLVEKSDLTAAEAWRIIDAFNAGGK